MITVKLLKEEKSAAMELTPDTEESVAELAKWMMALPERWRLDDPADLMRRANRFSSLVGVPFRVELV